jgi:hypothetical protein
MPSKRKSETARLNGAKSRGPTSAEGLAKSSRNALKHGFASGSSIVLACEDSDEFKLILADFIATYNPATPAEKDLVEEMVAARWRIRRLWTIETSLIDAEMLSPRPKFDNPDPAIQLALAFRALADDSRSLALAARYESRLQRTYARAWQTLRQLQQLRDLPNEPTLITVKWVNSDPESPTDDFAPEPISIPKPVVNLPVTEPIPIEAGAGNKALGVLRSYAIRMTKALAPVDTVPRRRLASPGENVFENVFNDILKNWRSFALRVSATEPRP